MNVYDNLRGCYLNTLPCRRPIEIRARDVDLSLTEREGRLLQRQLGECLAEIDLRCAIEDNMNPCIAKRQ